MEIPLQRVEEFLHQRIPLSKAMNCQVIECTNDSIAIRAPKFANTVEGESLFSGSVITLASLSAWTLLQVSLRRLDYVPEIDLVKSKWIREDDPELDSDGFAARCSLPEDKEWQQFLRMLSRKSQANVTLSIESSGAHRAIGTLTCEFEARDLDQR